MMTLEKKETIFFRVKTQQFADRNYKTLEEARNRVHKCMLSDMEYFMMQQTQPKHPHTYKIYQVKEIETEVTF